MTFDQLIHSFYRLPIPAAILLLLAFSFLFTTAYYYFHTKPWWKPALIMASVLVLAGIFGITIWGREPGGVTIIHFQPLHSYLLWLRGENAESLRSNLMNIFLFFPLGLLVAAALPDMWSWRKRITIVVFFGCMVSIGIEGTQFFLHCGDVETDDSINNTLGALLGSSSIPLEMRIWKKIRQ